LPGISDGLLSWSTSEKYFSPIELISHLHDLETIAFLAVCAIPTIEKPNSLIGTLKVFLGALSHSELVALAFTR